MFSLVPCDASILSLVPSIFFLFYPSYITIYVITKLNAEECNTVPLPQFLQFIHNICHPRGTKLEFLFLFIKPVMLL